jgi:hypothetical protein
MFDPSKSDEFDAIPEDEVPFPLALVFSIVALILIGSTALLALTR